LSNFNLLNVLLAFEGRSTTVKIQVYRSNIDQLQFFEKKEIISIFFYFHRNISPVLITKETDPRLKSGRRIIFSIFCQKYWGTYWGTLVPLIGAFIGAPLIFRL